MKYAVRPLIMITLSLVFLSGCASQVYHDYIMSGQIVAIDDQEVLVCVSDTDSLKEHSVFNVYRTAYDASVTTEGESGYTREFVGKIRLGEKKDKHFAEAIVVAGDLIRYDMVEFNRD